MGSRVRSVWTPPELPHSHSGAVRHTCLTCSEPIFISRNPYSALNGQWTHYTPLENQSHYAVLTAQSPHPVGQGLLETLLTRGLEGVGT